LKRQFKVNVDLFEDLGGIAGHNCVQDPQVFDEDFVYPGVPVGHYPDAEVKLPLPK
jgi:hypothetical protein